MTAPREQYGHQQIYEDLARQRVQQPSEIDALRAENVRLHTALANLHRQAQRLWTTESNGSLHEQAVDVWSDLIDAIEGADKVLDDSKAVRD